ILAACVAWASWNLSRALDTGQEDQRLGQQIAALNREYDKITRSLPSFGVGGSTMRDSVAFYNAAIRGFPQVTDFASALSTVLGRYPAIRIAQISWIATDDANALPVLSKTTASDSMPVKAIAKAEPAPKAAEAASGAFSTGRYEVALVEGTVRVPGNDFRGALDSVEKLAAD